MYHIHTHRIKLLNIEYWFVNMLNAWPAYFKKSPSTEKINFHLSISSCIKVWIGHHLIANENFISFTSLYLYYCYYDWNTFSPQKLKKKKMFLFRYVYTYNIFYALCFRKEKKYVCRGVIIRWTEFLFDVFWFRHPKHIWRKHEKQQIGHVAIWQKFVRKIADQ